MEPTTTRRVHPGKHGGRGPQPLRPLCPPRYRPARRGLTAPPAYRLPRQGRRLARAWGHARKQQGRQRRECLGGQRTGQGRQGGGQVLFFL
jgi:hypothetical protein